jgi:hypothetical protein
VAIEDAAVRRLQAHAHGSSFTMQVDPLTQYRAKVKCCEIKYKPFNTEDSKSRPFG